MDIYSEPECFGAFGLHTYTVVGLNIPAAEYECALSLRASRVPKTNIFTYQIDVGSS